MLSSSASSSSCCIGGALEGLLSAGQAVMLRVQHATCSPLLCWPHPHPPHHARYVLHGMSSTELRPGSTLWCHAATHPQVEYNYAAHAHTCRYPASAATTRARLPSSLALAGWGWLACSRHAQTWQQTRREWPQHTAHSTQHRACTDLATPE
jgi:hypothetical protein